MDYKKKSLNKLSSNESYEEIDTRLASGWYVDSVGKNNKKKNIKLKKYSFKNIFKKTKNYKISFILRLAHKKKKLLFVNVQITKTGHKISKNVSI